MYPIVQIETRHGGENELGWMKVIKQIEIGDRDSSRGFDDLVVTNT